LGEALESLPVPVQQQPPAFVEIPKPEPCRTSESVIVEAPAQPAAQCAEIVLLKSTIIFNIIFFYSLNTLLKLQEYKSLSARQNITTVFE